TDAKQGEAGGFGDASSGGDDLERETVRVRPGPPRPHVGTGRYAEVRKALAVPGRGARQVIARHVARLQVHFVIGTEEGDEVSRAITGQSLERRAPETRWPSEPGVSINVGT